MITEFTAGRLKVKVLETSVEMGKRAATEAAAAVRAVIAEKGVCRVLFAAAPSMNEFFDSLCEESVDWTKVIAFHMDEYLGLSAAAPQRFGHFLKERLFCRLPLREIHYIDGNAADAEAEIDRYSRLLADNPPDVTFMGIGENGHIAFNDPGVSKFDDGCLMKVVELDRRCRQQQVNDRCFDRIDQVPTHALTLTVPALFSSPRIFCVVPRATKSAAVKEAVTGEIRESMPASILRMHPCASLYVDRDSGSNLLAGRYSAV